MLDFATIVGVGVGLTVVYLAILTGSDFWIFLNLAGFLIVVVLTIAATMIKFPMSGILLAFPAGLKAAFTNKKDSPRGYIRDAIKLSKTRPEQGMLVLDQIKLRNPFFQQGVQLCADGRELPYIRKFLTQHMAQAIKEEKIDNHSLTNSCGTTCNDTNLSLKTAFHVPSPLFRCYMQQ